MPVELIDGGGRGIHQIGAAKQVVGSHPQGICQALEVVERRLASACFEMRYGRCPEGLPAGQARSG